jgi:hypothetical protein
MGEASGWVVETGHGWAQVLFVAGDWAVNSRGALDAELGRPLAFFSGPISLFSQFPLSVCLCLFAPRGFLSSARLSPFSSSTDYTHVGDDRAALLWLVSDCLAGWFRAKQ